MSNIIAGIKFYSRKLESVEGKEAAHKALRSRYLAEIAKLKAELKAAA